MSINNLNTYLNVRDAHLRVVSGNVYAQAMNIGGINVETAHGLQSVSDTGNVTSNTLQFSNATTGFITTANAQIGRDLVVTGNATVSTDLTVSANATVTDTLTVSEHLIASKEATITGNLHVTTIRSDSNVVAEYTGPHDRPLRKYPEVAMTANDNSSTNGYSVVQSTQSTNSTETRKAWSLFNHVTSGSGGNTYHGDDGVTTNSISSPYNNSDGTYQENPVESLGGVNGTWLYIRLPKKISLDHVKFISRAGQPQRVPRSATFLGSNNGTNWENIFSFSDVSLIGDSSSGEHTYTYNVNSTVKYEYFGFVWEKIGTNYYVNIEELELYGHEEGSGSLDTTLKTVYNAPVTTGTQLEVYYDAKDLDNGALTSVSGLGGTTIGGTAYGDPQISNGAFVFDGTGDAIQTAATSFTGNAIFTASLWVKFDRVTDSTSENVIFTIGYDGTPTQSGLRVNEGTGKFRFYTYGGNGSLTTEVTAVTNTWYHLNLVHNASSGYQLYINGEMVGETLTDNLNLPSNPTVGLGAAFSSSGTITSGTLPFKGSIANFRLYSKALNADQVKELYDYQKDYFLGSKSQVTLYKGHLGIGVTEPSGQLELAGDERIQEYPPRGVTGYETLVEGHGVFCAYASGEPSSGSYHSYQAFNKIQASPWPGNTWNTHNPSYSTSTGLPTRGTKLGSHNGEWLKLVLPYKIKVTSYQIQIYGAYYEYAPDSWVIVGSNDDIIWETIDSISGSGFTNSGTVVTKNYTVSSTKYYKYLALVCTKLDPQYSRAELNISELRYFGTPGPTTLDKGSLTLGRSLDVPRISRYDVDTETPRPEKLVVDFDTTVNSSPTDISGKGNHGKLQITTYNAPNKSFDVAGGASALGSYKGGIEAITSTVGTGPLTVSFWVKYHDDVTTNGHLHMIFLWGHTSNSAFGNKEMFWLGFQYFGGEYRFRLTASGGGPENYYLHPNTTKPEVGRWYHYTATQEGTLPGGFRFYIDGEELTSHANNTANSGVMNLAGSTSQSKLRLGYHEGSTVYFDGEFSQIKAYDVALEPSEVKKLYNLGRTGRSMVISDTAVGIGKAPEAQLDVRGDIKTSGMVNNAGMGWFITGDGGNAVYTGTENWFSSNGDSTVYGTVKKTRNGADPNAWNATTGFFTAPEDGMYSIDMVMFINGFDGGRWGSFELQDSNSNQVEDTYTFYTANITVDDTRSYSKTVYMKKDWKFRFYSAGGTVTLYLAAVHSSLNINKIS